MLPRGNILVTFTADRTFSITCTKSVTKLWIAPDGQIHNFQEPL